MGQRARRWGWVLVAASGTSAWLQSRFCVYTSALSPGYTMATGCMCGILCECLSGFSGCSGCAAVAAAKSPWCSVSGRWPSHPTHWEPSLLSAWPLSSALEARRIRGLVLSSSWTKRGQEFGMSVLPSNTVLKMGLQLGGGRECLHFPAPIALDVEMKGPGDWL